MAATDEERGGKRRGSSPAGSLLAERPDGLHFSELWKLVVASLSLTEEDIERPKSGDTKGENAWKWQTSDLVMAGWLRLRAGGSAASLAAVRRALPIPGAPPPGRGRGSPAQAGSEGIPSSDLYQMLAYCTSLGLSFGHLVYAKGRSPRGSHQVRRAGVVITQHALELDRDPVDLLASMNEIAEYLVRSR